MRRTDGIRLAVIIFFISLCLPLVMHRETSARQTNTAEAPRQGGNTQVQEEPKNLQVFKGMTRQQVVAVMRTWTEALGVECNYCHVRPFDVDTPRKAVARLMQRDYVSGMKHKSGTALTCKDCHQGQSNFLRTLPFENAVGVKLPHIRVLTGMDREKIKLVMDGFTKALGVKCSNCHTQNDETDTPSKQIARFMMREFSGELLKQDGSAVGCADCHQGHSRLLTVLPFPKREERRPAGKAEPTPKS